MLLQMVGVDFHQVPLSLREYGAFSEEELHLYLPMLVNEPGVSGAVLLSTCNRTELYLHTKEELQAKDLFDTLLRYKNVPETVREQLRFALTVRRGFDVSVYLMEVACGIHSQIFAEDQIISQVRQGRLSARDCGAIDAMLERLFQSAVTAAKRVKSECRLFGMGAGTAPVLIRKLKESMELKGSAALVIGNGEMGREAAEALVREGTAVTMTVRHYKTREVIIPAGCKVIDYTERFDFLKKADLVVSATRSPHLTLTVEQLQPLAKAKKLPFMADLAVPHDLPLELENWAPDRYLNMDKLGSVGPDEQQKKLLSDARNILLEEETEFENWCYTRQLAPLVRRIADTAADELLARVEKPIRRYADGSEELREAIWNGAAKTITSMIFGAQKALDPADWERLLAALSVQEDV